MAGFGLPTQRALVMLLVFAGAIVLRRRSSSANALALAAVAVLAWHPPSILDAGFWLSFAAVATILVTLQWTRGRPAWVAAITVQLALTLALWPVLLGAGLPASGISPLVNLVLVPLFGVLIVPWSLLGGLATLLVPDGVATLLWPLGQLLDLVAAGLAVAAHWSPSLPGLGPAALWLLVPAVCLLLLPPGLPLRWAGVPLLALPWLPRAPLVEPGEFQLHLLDVGQGLSAVVETHRHVLVFDTGPIYPSGFSTAEAVVLPFLARRGHERVSHLMISHGDKDHGGGLDVLRARIGIDRVSGGEPGRIGLGDAACAAGQRWHWDGVDFTVLYPDPASPLSGNNASCVLRVENAAGALLLTGDIEAAVERRLIRNQPDALGARVVVAPHHGSRSSSTAEFIAATSPDRVLFAAGWANPYGFPDPDVVARWIDGGALSHETAQEGTLSFRFASDGRLHGPTGYRVRAQRFWSAVPETTIAGTADRGLAVSSRHQAGPARRSKGG
jgi:competence protein ComEC